jgi:hypothetical protein
MLLFTLVTPILGIIQVEQGSYAPSALRWGQPNGATYAFLVYSLFALLGAWVATRGALFRAMPAPTISAEAAKDAPEFRKLALPLSLVLLALMLVAFGGAAVLTGAVGKGEFRTSFGGLGALAYLTLKWLAPCVFAFACVLFVLAGRPRSGRWALAGIGFLTFFVGLSWGFKTSGLLVVMPGFIVLLWWARPKAFLLSGLLAVAGIFLAFRMFDAGQTGIYESAFQFLFARITVFQGDVSWLMWDKLINGEDLPYYWGTPFVAIGDQLYSAITGITRADPEKWISVHYGAMLTYATGYPIEGIEAGHSVTGTPFSEGVIALGMLGIPVFGLAAGLITGFVFNRLSAALFEGRPLSATLWANYAVWCLFAWLNGGEIIQLFHISVIVGAIAARVLLSVAMGVVRTKRGALPSVSP